MLRTRFLSAIVLIPIVFWCIYLGAWPFLILVTLLLTLAEIEFCQLMTRGGFRPTAIFGLGMVWLLLMDAQLNTLFPTLDLLRPGMVLLVIGSLGWQMFHRQSSPVTDWALTVTGGLYLGLCGASLIALRSLQPDGLWWTVTTIPAIMFADSGAFFFGRAWGRHKLAPTLSPGKTWEGYVAGVIVGGLLTYLLASLWHWAGAATTTSAHGLTLGILIAIFAPLGDLAVSMIKRQVGAKDSGVIIPGHGGALDRVDSVLWAAVIGYYYVQMFVPQ